MPDPLPVPTAPSSIKASDSHHEFRSSRHLLPTTPSPWTEPITSPPGSVSRESAGVVVPNDRRQRCATFEEQVPQLSERDSIFATHCHRLADNEQSTPLLRPFSAGTEGSDVEGITSDMELPLPSIPAPSKLSIKALVSTPRMLSGAPIVGSQHHKQLENKTYHEGQRKTSTGTIHGVRRVASEGHSWSKKFHVIVPTPTVTSKPIPLRRLHASHEMSDTSAESDTGAVLDDEDSGHRPQRGAAMKDALRHSTPEERSRSRSRTHVEKSIEATLANAEPAKNVRSRKSSHYMGLFKENTAVPEIKKRDVKSKETNSRPAEEDFLSTKAVAFREDGLEQSNEGTSTTTNTKLRVSSPDNGNRVSGSTERASSEPGAQEESDRPSSSAAPNPSQLSTMIIDTSQKSEHSPYFRQQDELQTPSFKRPRLPARLLQEIREHHNLTPGGAQGSTLSRSLLSLADEKLGEVQLRCADLEPQEIEEHDEDEEHISSAVYFPHPGHTAEEIESFTSPNDPLEGALSHVVAPIPRAADKKKLKSESILPFVDAVPHEHIDISVELKHEKSVFHGDYQPLDESPVEAEWPALPTIGETVASSASSASESEFESGDDFGESSQAEDGGTTPTATSRRNNNFRSKQRRYSFIGPKGAVVLEPYSHQVGGHSTIFRFSRRAVCKQLNNRENEFYERIERRHPDMLRFLPRSVTFSLSFPN